MAKTLPTDQLTLPLQVPIGRAAPRPDGRTCIVSSEIGPEDRQALLDLFARSSPETRRDRFHHALSVFPQLYLDEIVSGKQLAVAARDTCHEESYGKVFGLASAAPVAAGIAEFAVWVEDAWQGRGVGSLLTRAILRLLAKQQITTAIGIMEPDNFAIRRLVNRHRYPQIQFMTDTSASELNTNCDLNSGAGCVLPPQGPGHFFPYFTQATVGGACVWEFGNMRNGNTFGGDAQYGTVGPGTLGAFAGPIRSNPNC